MPVIKKLLGWVREKNTPPPRLVEGLGLVGMFNFSCAESNANQLEQRIFLICIRFGTWEVSLRHKRTNPGYVRLRDSAQIRVLESRRVLHNVYLILIGVKFRSILDEFWLGIGLIEHPIRIHLILIKILHQSVSSTHYEVLYGIPEHEFVRYFADGEFDVCTRPYRVK